MRVVGERQARKTLAIATTVAASIESFVVPVARELEMRGYQVHFITGDRAPEVNFPHTSAVLPMVRRIAAKADGRSLRQWIKHLRSLRPLALIAGTPKASMIGMVAARAAGVSVRVYVIHGAVWDGRSGPRSRLLLEADRLTFAMATHHLAVSDSLARMISHRGLTRRMPDVIGSGSFCGVDTNAFEPGPSCRHESNSMCYIGRVHRDKGIEVALRTLDRVRAEVDATLTVVGSIDETAPPSSETIRALEGHPRVNWVRGVPDVTPYLQQAGILLLPTSREGLPQTVLEAQSAGVPVVSWRVTGVVDAIRDGFTGTLVRFGDENALAAAATELLADPSRQQQMGKWGREFVSKRFEQRLVVEANASYLDDAVCATQGN